MGLGFSPVGSVLIAEIGHYPPVVLSTSCSICFQSASVRSLRRAANNQPPAGPRFASQSRGRSSPAANAVNSKRPPAKRSTCTVLMLICSFIPRLCWDEDQAFNLRP